MQQYHDFLNHILTNGSYKDDRTSTGTYSIFGYQMRFDLSKGFPLVTTKYIHMKSIIHELLWFINGDTNNKYLTDNGVNIWTAWANQQGELGPIYGQQWRSWPSFNLNYAKLSTDRTIITQYEPIDQLQQVINQIKSNPNSRRLIISGWNPAVLPDESLPHNENIENGKAVLPPCHTLFQFYVLDGKLSCQLYQRSGDAFLGVPFNIASYSLLVHMIAHICDLQVGDFIHTFGDAHIYVNHMDQIKTQLSRDIKSLPTLHINRKVSDINDFKYEDFEILDYNPHPKITAPVAV